MATKTMKLVNKQWHVKLHLDGSELTITKFRTGGKPKSETFEYDSDEDALADAKATYKEFRSKGYTKEQAKEVKEEPEKKDKAKAKKSKTSQRRPAASESVVPGAKGRKKKANERVALAILDGKYKSEFLMACKTGDEIIGAVNSMRERLWGLNGSARCNEDTLNMLVKEFPIVPADPGTFEKGTTKLGVMIYPRRAGLKVLADTEKGKAVVAFDLVSRKDPKAEPKAFEEFVDAETLDEVIKGNA